MLNMELYLYGLETTLDEIIDDLNNALGNNNSKKYKDYQIGKALGAIKAVRNMVNVTEKNYNAE